MRNNTNNQRGMTLIELLVAVVISAILIIVTFSILTQSLNQQQKQTSNNNYLTEMRYVLKIITKDMRQSIVLNKVDGKFHFTSLNNVAVANYSFDKGNNIILRNETPIASSIKTFTIENNLTSVKIYIESLNNNRIETELYFRSGEN